MENEKFDNSKQYYVDFHTHSSRSDGKYSREELIEKAIEESVGAMMILAITDHNMPFDDILELQDKYENKVKLLSGSEISTSYNVPRTGEKIEVHIIALDYIENQDFIDLLKRNQHDKRPYIEAILKKLEDVGYQVGTYDELVEYAYPSTHIGRMTIARAMEKKFGFTIDECFDRFFGSYGEKTCYVPNNFDYVTMEEAVRICKKAKAITVLCHPYFYSLEEADMLELIRFFRSVGGDAMETLYGKYSKEQIANLQEICKSLGLKESAGSDNHMNPGEHFGKYPVTIYNELMKSERG